MLLRNYCFLLLAPPLLADSLPHPVAESAALHKKDTRINDLLLQQGNEGEGCRNSPSGSAAVEPTMESVHKFSRIPKGRTKTTPKGIWVIRKAAAQLSLVFSVGKGPEESKGLVHPPAVVQAMLYYRL